MTDLGNRRTYLGASDVAAALGYSPYETQLDVWRFKTGRISGKPKTPQMERGHDLEDVIGKLYTRATQRPIVAEQAEFIHPDRDWLRCHADGVVEDPKRGTGLLELKAPGAHRVRDFIETGLPADYIFQLHTNMMLARKGWISVAVYDYENHRVIHFDVDADPAFQASILAGVDMFWGYVQSDTPPPEAVASITVPQVDGELVVLDGAKHEELADILLQARTSKLLAETEEEKAIAAVKAIMEAKGLSLVQLGRNCRVSWKPGAPRVSVDSTRLMAWVDEVVRAINCGDTDFVIKAAKVFKPDNFQKSTPMRPFRPTFYGEAKEEITNARAQ